MAIIAAIAAIATTTATITKLSRRGWEVFDYYFLQDQYQCSDRSFPARIQPYQGHVSTATYCLYSAYYFADLSPDASLTAFLRQ